jgi:hypothetical protein
VEFRGARKAKENCKINLSPFSFQASRMLVLKAEKDQQLKKMLRRVDAFIGHVRS